MSNEIETIADIKNKISEYQKEFIFRGENKNYSKICSILYREQKKILELEKEEDVFEVLKFPKIQQEIINNAKKTF